MKNILTKLKVSTDEQVNQGYSMEHQEKTCEIEFESQRKVTYSGALLQSISLALPEIEKIKTS